MNKFHKNLGNANTISRRQLMHAMSAFALATPLITRAQGAPLRVQLSWLPQAESAGLYFAQEMGFFKEQGLDVSLLPGGPQVDPVTVLAGGSVDIAIVSLPLSVLAARSRGVPLQVIGTGLKRSPMGLTSRADRNLSMPKDLKGRKIGYQQVNRPLFRAFLKANQVSEGQYESSIVTADPTPLTEGKIDLMTVHTLNVPLALEERGIKTKSWSSNDLGVPLEHMIVVTTQNTLATKRSEVERFTRAMLKGWDANNRNPEQSTRLFIEKYASTLSYTHQLGFNRKQADLMISPLTQQKGQFWMDRSAWDQANQMSVEAELISSSVNLDSLLNYDVLEKVRART